MAARIMSSSGTARVFSVMTGSRSRSSSSDCGGGGGRGAGRVAGRLQHALQLRERCGQIRREYGSRYGS